MRSVEEAKPATSRSRLPSMLLAFALALGYGASQVVWGEQTPFAGGYHPDAVVYARAAGNLEALIASRALHWYWVQRLAPTVIVHFAMRIARIPLQDRNILLAFEIYSLIIWLIGIGIWWLIATELRLSEKNAWLGMILLFVNHANLKMRFFLPTFSDNSAFLLGLLLVYFFLRRQSFGVWSVMVVGEFTWPSIFLFAAPLFLFPFRSLPPRPARAASLGVGALAALVFLGLYLFPLAPVGNFQGYQRGKGLAGTLALTLAVLYLFSVTRSLFNSRALFDARLLWQDRVWKRLVVIALTAAGIRLLVRSLGNNAPFSGVSTVAQWAEVTLVASATQLPLLFLVAAAVYLGLIVLLAIFKLPDLSRQIQDWGSGAVLFAWGSAVFLLDSQSRHLIHALPFWAAAAAKAAEAFEWRPRHYWTLALTALVVSKVWLPYGLKGASDFVNCAAPEHYRLCANSGPSMPFWLYVSQGVVLGILVILLYQVLTPLSGAGDAQASRRGATTLRPTVE
jgi:hypothetical protein